MALIDAKWLNKATLAVNDYYVGPDAPGTGNNVLTDGQMRLWKNTGSGDTFVVSRVGAVYLTTPFFNDIIDGGIL